MIIIYNSEDIADAYGPSLNAAFVELRQASGITPRVVAPYGAWSSPAVDAFYHIKGRGPGSDHYKGRAVDIANYAAIIAAIGLSRLKAIMARHGWRNVQINGDDFSAEPWHYANHTPASDLASEDATPLTPPTQEDESMTPRTYTTDGGKTFRIMFPDGRSKPLTDYKTGAPLAPAAIVALNLFLRYAPDYYPNGIRGAAVMVPSTAAQFAHALDPAGAAR